jgi:hypothetical protein
MENRDYERRKFISTLMKIEHGKLEGFVNDGLLASRSEPELFAHFIAWNEIKGKVRDSKVAYPVIALRSIGKTDRDLAENAVAHLMKLSPRDLVRGYKFSREMTQKPTSFSWELFENAAKLYLRKREENQRWWDKTVLTHRKSMRDLYRIFRVKPSDRARGILFDSVYPLGSIFAKVKGLRDFTPKEAASVILTEKIPFEVVVGSVNVKDHSILLALIEGMTGNQIVTNSKMLEKLGVKNDPILKAAYESALARAKDDKRLNVLKAGVAAERADSSDALRNLQAQATRQLGSIEGNWLILGDCSGSMSSSVELAKKVASFITERVSGKVWLIFFNTVPTPFDVTGKTFFQIQEMTKRVQAVGGTSIGCGLDYISAGGECIDGIAIVSDGGENNPPYFSHVYKKYSEKIGKEPTVYFYDVAGDTDNLSHQLPNIEKFDMRHGKVDYYSLPNLVATMRTNRYSLVDEIMSVPLLTLEKIFEKGVS